MLHEMMQHLWHGRAHDASRVVVRIRVTIGAMASTARTVETSPPFFQNVLEGSIGHIGDVASATRRHFSE
jgi:hypothetical protein